MLRIYKNYSLREIPKTGFMDFGLLYESDAGEYVVLNDVRIADIPLASLVYLFVHVSTNCVPIAHLRQNKPFPLLYLGHAQITMLDPFAQLFQHCWGYARPLCLVYKELWVVSFPRCTAGPNIVGSFCVRLHTAANTHATTPNIVGATMLGVAAFVCTQPNIRGRLLLE